MSSQPENAGATEPLILRRRTFVRREHGSDSLQDYVEVQDHGNVLYVIQIELDPRECIFMRHRIALHLAPAHHTGLNYVALPVIRDQLAENVAKLHTLGPWAYERHLSANDIEQTRKNVQLVLAEKFFEPGTL